METKRKKKIIIVIAIISAILIIFSGVFYIYTLDYYKADENANMILEAADSNGNLTVFYPEGERLETGFIFYPGGKVEASAYAPLLKALSENGITCVLVEMPFNLAVFGVNSANKVYDQFPEIESWYLGGHSLGGAMASSYVNKNSDKLDGLILLGAYPINYSSIPTLAIYGTEDHGLDMTKLSEVANKVELTGGNHAYFGNYGEQKGDGTASMTRDEQQALAVEAIVNFIK